MAKYNLLEDDDIFDEENDLSAEDTGKKPITEDPASELAEDIDINIDENIIEDQTDEPADEHDFHDELAMDDISTVSKEPPLETEKTETPEEQPEQESEFVEYEPLKEEAKEEPKPKVDPEKPYLTDDYADDKHPGLNYKPLIIAAIVIVVLILGYIGLDKWVLSDQASSETANETQQPVKTAQQLLQEQAAARKTRFLSDIAGKTSSDIDMVNSAIQNAASSAKISSILLYDKSFLFEVFGSNRDEVARVSMALKQKMADNNFNVVSSQTRPGTNGGVFGLFKADLKNEKPAGANAGKNIHINFNSVKDAENWLKQQSASKGLKVRSLQNHFVKDADDFKVFEVATTVNGSIDACKGLLQKISSDGSQIKIHKLNLSAADQKSFISKKYQLKLILEIFV
jgi:outer membrane biosynthesis protein TonB